MTKMRVEFIKDDDGYVDGCYYNDHRQIDGSMQKMSLIWHAAKELEGEEEEFGVLMPR